jgi:aspartokinase-like uncharacterized kinase
VRKKAADEKQMADQAVEEYNLAKNLQEAFAESMDKCTPEVLEKVESGARVVSALLAAFCSRE